MYCISEAVCTKKEGNLLWFQRVWFSFRIEMYAEGVQDLMQMIMALPFMPPDAKKTKLEEIERKATSRYLPVFEKVLYDLGLGQMGRVELTKGRKSNLSRYISITIATYHVC